MFKTQEGPIVDADFTEVKGESTNQTTNNTKEEKTMNTFAEMLAGMFTAGAADKATVTKAGVAAVGKGAVASIKSFGKKAYTYIKDLSVSLYNKVKDFSSTTTGRRVMKAGLAMASVAVAGTFTTGAHMALLAGMGIFGTARAVSNMITGKTAWTWNDVLVNLAKDLAYVSVATALYVYAAPYAIQWTLDGLVWVINAFVSAFNYGMYIIAA